MIINEEGKLFGKISIIDIVIILCAVIFIAAIGVRFILPSKFETSTAVYTYEGTVKNVRIESVEAIKKGVDKMWYDDKGTPVGMLKSVEEKPYIADVTKTDGTVVLAEMPTKYEVQLEFEAEALKGKSSIMLGGKREVSNGSSLLANSDNIAVTYSISDIKEK